MHLQSSLFNVYYAVRHSPFGQAIRCRFSMSPDAFQSPPPPLPEACRATQGYEFKTEVKDHVNKKYAYKGPIKGTYEWP